MAAPSAPRPDPDWIIDAPLASLASGAVSAQPGPDPHTVSLSEFVRAFQDLRAEMGDGTAIWSLGAGYDLDELGPTGTAIRTAPSLGDALSALRTGFPLIQSGALVAFDSSGDRAEFQYRVLNPGVWPRQADAELTMGLVFGVVSRFVPDAARVVDVRFEHAPDAASGRLERAIRRPFDMMAEANVLSLPAGALHARSQVGADAAAHVAARGLLEDRVQQKLGALPVTTRVRNQILRHLGRASVDQADVARVLGCSDRSLRDQLNAAGTSYRQLLEACRLETARVLLTETPLGLAEISDRLGYSEQSAFSRAARRWFGCAPERLRPH
ncbi:AraC-like transcriptional regulator QhpR [Roseivivax marinus]|uniref:AraC-like transcriptional regulator QhpR n=1 Tax=Roseivivax marinus TaxID=1379903 RepID=UPI00273ECF5A|nr:AraC family transcriptional regulator [Roseivivax marinus]